VARQASAPPTTAAAIGNHNHQRDLISVDSCSSAVVMKGSAISYCEKISANRGKTNTTRMLMTDPAISVSSTG
jgi:hypothetical protein